MIDHAELIEPIISAEELSAALDAIGIALGDVDDILRQGLPDGTNPDWGFDRKLIMEIAEACRRWSQRA